MTHYFGGLFKDLSHAVANFAEVSSKAFEEAYDQTQWDASGYQEVASAATLTQVDLLMLDWAESQDEVITTESRAFVDQNVNKIKQGLREAQAGYLAGTDIQEPQLLVKHNMTEMQSAVAKIERLAQDIKPKSGAITIEDNIESRLDASKLLNPRIAVCLDVLRAALGQQLSSCGHQHVVRLKLTGFSENFDFDSQKRLVLDLFLSSRFDWTPCRWLQSRCTIVRSLESTEARGCHFIKDTEVEKQSLALRISEQPLGSLIRDPTNAFADSTFPTVSIGFLIDGSYFNTRWGKQDEHNRTFLPGERATLCYILAKSLSHLSGGAWNHVKWNIDGIYFLEDPSTQKLLDKHRPYLSWKLEPLNTDAATRDGPNHMSDPHSQLIDFARLLMEVHAGERITFNGPAKDLQKFLSTLIADPQRSASPQKEKFLLAVEACLGPAGKEAALDQSDPERLKIFLFRRVLPNLEMCSNVYTEPQLEGNQVPVESRFVRANGMNPRQPRSPYDGHTCDKPKNQCAADDAKTFFERMKSFNKDHILPLASECSGREVPKHLKPRIKIAIIDSGIKLDDTRITAHKDRIQEKRNFLPGPPEAWNDAHGHGTHVAWLVLKMAPQAEVYIAKVSDGWFVENDKVNCIAQASHFVPARLGAINWAVQEWQVDIITMSLVLHSPNEAIKAELMQAVNPSCEGLHRRIVFAAAGNAGGNDPMPWPASLQVSCPGIIPIHATDGMGTASRINPTVADSTAPIWCPLESFATLGLDIQGQWKPKGAKTKDVFISGTSFATPIAAAIAADVLEYARHKLQLTKDQKNMLYSGVYMRRIFAMMGQKRGDYEYVQPWTLWDKGRDNGYGQFRKMPDLLYDIIAT